jgi:nucleotide-binding universal stress UspA family protein
MNDPRQRSGTVVVGCDGSWASQRAVVAATGEAARRGITLVLLAVAEPGSVREDRLEIVRSAAEDAMAVTERAAALACDVDPAQPTRVVIAPDVASAALADLARGAVLLVLGRHGVHGQVAFSLGSTSAELARRFGCPVFVSRDRSGGEEVVEGEPPVVLVGLDAGPDSARVLSAAAHEAAVRGTRLVALHAIRSGRPRSRADLAVGWQRVHDAVRAANLPVGIPSRLVITRDEPATALVIRARPDDLLVVGTRGGGRLAGLVEGSVSRAVLAAMPCDVVVVQPPRQAGDPRATGLAAVGSDRGDGR